MSSKQISEENIPLKKLESDFSQIPRLTSESSLIEEKEKLKEQVKQQYKSLIKTIDRIGEIRLKPDSSYYVEETKENIENKKSIVDLDDLTHFDIDKIYCNCCGFTSVEQNIKKTTFYIITFISNILLMIEMTICMFLLLSNNKDNSINNSSSSYVDNLNVD